MARQSRFVVADQPHVIVQRGHGALTLFADAGDAATYLSVLGQAARAHDLRLHAFGLHGNEVRLLLTPPSVPALSKAMQGVARRYAEMANRRHHRSGTPWQGRYQASLIDAGDELVSAMRFVEFLTAESRGAPLATSTAAHAGERPDPMLIAHAGYWQLGNTPFDREAAYRAVAAQPLEATAVARYVLAVRSGWPIGSEAFLQQVQKMHGRPAKPRPRGRPQK